ncbi:GTP pyrophosphokinase family protein [Nocardioides immobilis]|uniref:GTP pyrophosphokinase family protein n=1 Tax=Nocardioides immobilis TaxID=2049295 RepID=A0A417XUE1_9ACTN|nr:GTP pyrophosphokinase family protein [Nocardioides immobilis]RHW24089.1 GTP pyrophosphokinase family protein [Nocardioides immobilis]
MTAPEPELAQPGEVAFLDGQGHELRQVHRRLNRFRMRYKFAIDEVTTKIAILREEFEEAYDHSPIEHVRSRLKSPDSLFAKAAKRGADGSLDAIAESVLDIAGVRVVCPFVSDVYWIKDMLTRQSDVTVLEVEDYIATPKPNGYRSLHLTIEVPVFLSDRTENVPVELQIRTIAMDFWASVEHSIYYKYDATVPHGLLEELTDAARIAADLDARMTQLRAEVRDLDQPPA